MSSFNGGRRVALAAATAASVFVLAAAAAAQTAQAPALPDEPFIPRYTQHDKPTPWPIIPMVRYGTAPGEMPYRQDRVTLPGGALESVVDSARMAKIGGGWSGAGDAFQAHAQAAHRTANHLVMGAGTYHEGSNYEDGDGNDVRFGYKRDTEQLVLGWMPSGRSLRGAFIRDMIKDHQNPLSSVQQYGGTVPFMEGFGADPVETRRLVGRLSYEDTVTFEALEKFRVEASYIGLDRVADNFSLRDVPAGNPANRMRATPAADILGLTSSADFRAFGAYNRIGAEVRHTDHTGTRRGGADLGTVTGYQYPGVSLLEAALSAESAYDFTPDSHLTLGLRYDFAKGDADWADRPMVAGAGMAQFNGTPRQLYQTYYGHSDVSAKDHGLSARGRYQHDFLDDRANAYVALGRIVRMADTQERYFALPSPNTAAAAGGFQSRVVGNPQIDPEVHYRLDLGGELQGTGWVEWGRKGPDAGEWLASRSWRLAANAYVDRVHDFISRDRARRPVGMTVDYAAVWRNVDAILAGVEVDAQWNLTRNWSTRLNLAYTYGQNTTDDRPLYGINPLEANWIVDYHDLLGTIGTWHAGGKLRLVSGQDRADDNPLTGSGFDPFGTSGFGVLDLYAGMQFYDRFGVRVGIDNVFDRTYAEHNAHIATDETNVSAVNAPGRFFYARAVVAF